MPDTLRVGTRGSLLARAQTEWLLAQLRRRHPDAAFETIVIRTRGDLHTQEMPARMLGKGFFTKEIEDALLAGDIDLAVHSLKDLPTQWPDGLGIGAIPVREDPRDALVGATVRDLLDNPGARRIGTSSLRRTAQLRRLLPGCRVVSLRGNIDTRLEKVAAGDVDCAVLAAAGLLRASSGARISGFFAPDQMLPAPGQGALAVEIRRDDKALAARLAAIHCGETAACVDAERAFMRELGGGCQFPVAALGVADGARLHLRGRVLSLDGAEEFAGRETGSIEAPEDLGRKLADRLLAAGADALIAEIAEGLARG